MNENKNKNSRFEINIIPILQKNILETSIYCEQITSDNVVGIISS